MPFREAIYCRARWPAKKTECSCFAVFCAISSSALSRAALFAINRDNVWTGSVVIEVTRTSSPKKKTTELNRSGTAGGGLTMSARR